jgi:amino acid permease
MFLAGIPVALMINALCFVLQYLSTLLFIEGKAVIDAPIKTLYEFGYCSIGKSSIYFISFLAVVQTLGFLMIYFIVFGDIMSSLISQIFLHDNQSFFSSRLLWDVVLGLALLPIVLRKSLQEIKIISVIFFISIVIFILVLCV